MHILLTDILTCPRCGPAFGLILLANKSRDRRVLEGVLGCSNCREQYPVRDGVADFGATPEAVPPALDPEATERLAALFGVERGPAFLLLAGPAAGHASALAGMLEDVEVLTVGAGARPDDHPAVNRIQATGALPIASGKVAGVALTGSAADLFLEEGARIVSPTGRLVIEPVPDDVADRLAPHGMRVVAHEEDTALAVRG